MTIAPLEYSASLRVGAVEFVSPDEIKVALDLDAPDDIAANGGIPRAFPRVNSYVLVAAEAGYVVAQTEWVAVERSPFPKRKGFQDYGVIDLPFPLRKMRVNPLGILKREDSGFVFRRGVQGFPSVGEPVLIPTDEQLRAIIESGDKRRVTIGASPMAANADVSVDPNRLFGRHLAVLGNTGSGKSCSVAGLIQWSVEAAKESPDCRGRDPNARFIVLDPNGEYARAFHGSGRVFSPGDDENPLEVPLWFWNSEEWRSFSQASAKAQSPLLKRTLRAMRNEKFDAEPDITVEAKRFLGIILTSLRTSKSSGEPFKAFPHNKNFLDRIRSWNTSLGEFSEIDSIKDLSESIGRAAADHMTEYAPGRFNYETPSIGVVDDLIAQVRETFEGLGGQEAELLPKNEDIPTKFKGDVFVNVLEAFAQETGNEQYVEFLIARIRTMLSDTRMRKIIGDEVEISLGEWLEEVIGGDDESKGCVTIIDLSLVPSEIVSLITAVAARMVFEASQRYKKIEGKSLPTVLVAEEAHTFIKRYRDDSESQDASTVCCQVFEKIAREGRKFGLGLVLSSQRPSELSPTVLSQCNSFLLHRVSNDRDQELIGRLVPDSMRGLLRELPSLPSQQAILLGWAAELPIMVRMNDLAEHERPQSEDPDFWEVWSRSKERKVDWDAIADDWQQ